MFSAAIQRCAAGAFALFLWSRVCAASDSAGRTVPTRPGTSAKSTGSLASRRFGGVEYVNVADVADRLGLEVAWLERGKKLTLSNPPAAREAELERDTRDITINGLSVILGDPIVDAGGELYVSRIDYECCLTPLLRPGFGVPAQRPPKIVALDPGHGGRDNGSSVREKTYALDVARRARPLLESAGFKVVLTRDHDTYVDLARRTAIANLRHADLFVSIHFNALEHDSRTSGVEVYTFPPAKQHATNWWSVLRKADPDLETEDQPVNRFDHWSVLLAESIHHHFVVDLKAHDRGKKLMHLGVLRGLKCPGMLVECGFLTSAVEARKIATTAYRQQIAESIVAGVRDYAATLSRL